MSLNTEPDAFMPAPARSNGGEEGEGEGGTCALGVSGVSTIVAAAKEAFATGAEERGETEAGAETAR